MQGVINIEYPESLANALKLNNEEFASEMKRSSLVKLYELGKVSSGVAAKVLGLSRLDFWTYCPNIRFPRLIITMKMT